MNFDPKAVRRALMVAKDLATSIDPGFANIQPPMPPQGVPLERAKGGPIKIIEGADRERNLAEFMKDAHPDMFEKSGKPKVFYHGTTKDFSAFSNEDAPYRGGLLAFFSESPKFSGKYAEGSDGNVIPVHINVKNPFDFRDKFAHLDARNFFRDNGGVHEWDAQKIRDGLGLGPGKLTEDQFVRAVQKGHWPALEADEFVEWLRGLGHDAVVTKEGNAINYGVFDLSQIKSAVGNVGTFDPTDPDITKAEGGEVEAAGMGINVRSDKKAGMRYADEIVDGNKLYETRDTDSLRPYVGKRVAIVRTGEGPAKAIGEVTVGEPVVADQDMFHKMRPHHLVPAGSAFDIKQGGQKYLYPMHDPVRFDDEKNVGAGIIARKVINKAEGGSVDDQEWNYPVSEENMLQTHHAQRHGEGLPEGVVPEDMFDPRYNPGIGHATGPFTYAAEHIGDLVHRLSYVPKVGGGVDYGIEAAYTKARRNYDLRQDRLNESLQSNYKFYKDNGKFNGTFDEYLDKFDQAAKRYANAYRMIPVHTELQKLGRDAAVALGERNFYTAQRNLDEIKRRLEGENAHEEYWKPLARNPEKTEIGEINVKTPIIDSSKDARRALMIAKDELGHGRT